MRFRNTIHTDQRLTFDMTPMIDCTFQLVIFFMLTLNYAQENQDARIRLPESELARPSKVVLESAVTVQLTAQNTMVVAGDEVDLAGLRRLLDREKQVLYSSRRATGEGLTIIIRADRDAPAGRVQEMIQVCQQAGFDRFILRAKEDERSS